MSIPPKGLAALAAAVTAAVVALPGCDAHVSVRAATGAASDAPSRTLAGTTTTPGTPASTSSASTSASPSATGPRAAATRTPTTASPATAASTAASTAAGRRAAAVLARMTTAQKIGQVFMIGNDATAVAGSSLRAVSTYHVGNVMLRGRSSAGAAATARVSAGLAARVSHASTASVPLFIATDQEGGAVRVLRGPGFDLIPSALTQGSWSTTKLRAQAKRWGTQLHAAGVNLDLAPVLDTVPSATAARHNPPIGVFHREFGYSPAVVSSHGIAFLRGMADAGVDTSVKHFPGLGRVTGNPDSTAKVTDRVTTRTDPYLTPFRNAIAAGAPFLMMSTAYYTQLDPRHPAAFSPTVVTGIVRGDLGFTGVVISDDLGNAKQVAAWSPGSRAVQFLAAGGDLVLTVNTTLLPAMVKAVSAKVASDAAFAAKVDAAALRILTAKAQLGLL